MSDGDLPWSMINPSPAVAYVGVVDGALMDRWETTEPRAPFWNAPEEGALQVRTVGMCNLIIRGTITRAKLAH